MIDRSDNLRFNDSFSLLRLLTKASSLPGTDPEPKLVLVERCETSGEGGISKLPDGWISSVSEDEYMDLVVGRRDTEVEEDVD